MRTRHEDALFIIEGACNPVAIAGTIHRHMLDMTKSGADHHAIREDSAIRLMLHQLAFLCKVPDMDEQAFCNRFNTEGHDWATCPRCQYRERFGFSRALEDCRIEVKAAMEAAQ